MCFQKDPVAELTAQAKLGSSFDGDALHGSRTGVSSSSMAGSVQGTIGELKASLGD